MVDGYVLLLSDPVGPVSGLALDGRVPPRVEVDHVVGAGEVEPEPARLEADHERLLLSLLEVGDHLAAGADRGGAVEVEIAYPVFVELGVDHVEETGELAEYEHSVASGDYLAHKVGEFGELAGPAFPLFVDKGHRAGCLTEACDLGEDVDRDLALVFEVLLHLFAYGLVGEHLGVGELHRAYDVCLVRELVQHFGLCAAEDERLYDAFEAFEIRVGGVDEFG